MPAEPRREPDAYAWYLLAVLVLAYVLNYIDRQLLTILAPDLKRDLGISDADFGFLYGTAFGVFYAVFGIPLGRLADRWSRVRLLSLGLALWSAMTAMSGLSRNFAQLAAARIGVGVGEASAAPCAFSLIGDSFPPHRRATALGLYSTGLFLGGGVSLFLGSLIVREWNAAFAPGGAPFGLAGWQAAFLLIGLPGMLLALWIASLREPPRREGASRTAPWTGLLRDLGDVIPPFTLLGAARRGGGALLGNLLAAGTIAAAAWGLAAAAGDAPQWLALGLGAYAVFSWIASIRAAEPAAFAVLRSRIFLSLTIAYGLFTFVALANIAFTPLYAIEQLGADPVRAGLSIGAIGGLGGAGGTILGGVLADRLARRGGHSARIGLAIAGALAATVCHAAMFSVAALPLFYVLIFAVQLGNSLVLVGCSGALLNAVPGHLHGTASAAFLLGGNMLGSALGPYTAGKMSALLGDLGDGMLAILAVAPLLLLALAAAHRDPQLSSRA